MLWHPAFGIAVIVPTMLRDLLAVDQQAITHSLFDQTPSQQTLPAEALGVGIVEPIEPLSLLRFPGEIDDFRCFGLHPKRQLISADARFEFRSARPLVNVLLVEPLQKIELSALLLARQVWGKLQIQNRGPPERNKVPW